MSSKLFRSNKLRCCCGSKSTDERKELESKGGSKLFV